MYAVKHNKKSKKTQKSHKKVEITCEQLDFNKFEAGYWIAFLIKKKWQPGIVEIRAKKEFSVNVMLRTGKKMRSPN